MNIDKYDEKILDCLQANCRRPVSKIASECRLNEETCRYRAKKLEEENIILDYAVLINERALGIDRRVCYVQTSGEQAEHVLKDDNTTWATKNTGRYDLVYDWTGDEEPPIPTSSYAVYKVKNLLVNGIPLNQDTNHVLSDLQTDIIDLLRTNPRMSYVDIGLELDVAASTALRNVKELQEANIINSFTAVLNPTKLGKTWGNIRLKTSQRDEALQRFKEDDRFPYVYYYEINGAIDFDIGIYFDNQSDLQEQVSYLGSLPETKIIGTNYVQDELISNP